jgi:hypothetical protein
MSTPLLRVVCFGTQLGWLWVRHLEKAVRTHEIATVGDGLSGFARMPGLVSAVVSFMVVASGRRHRNSAVSELCWLDWVRPGIAAGDRSGAQDDPEQLGFVG